MEKQLVFIINLGWLFDPDFNHKKLKPACSKKSKKKFRYWKIDILTYLYLELHSQESDKKNQILNFS